MRDQKAENLLNLALATPEPEREKTDELYVGYNIEAKNLGADRKISWRASGSIERVVSGGTGGVSFKHYAILLVPETEVRR